jgi:hypothetical protein
MTETITAPHTLVQNNTSYRIDSIDFVRGLIMIIMALDHTRDFFHIKAWTEDPYYSGSLFYPLDHPFLCAGICFSGRQRRLFSGSQKKQKRAERIFDKTWLVADHRRADHHEFDFQF